MQKSESGRSMVEILAVLGLIGVLSIGGVAGYTTAMMKYKVNEILSGVRDRAMAISSYQGFQDKKAEDLLEYKDQKLKGYDVSLYSKEIEGTDFAIQVGKLRQDICEKVASQGLESSILVRPNLCDAEEDNIIIFGFKNTLEGRSDRRDQAGELSETQTLGYKSEPCTSQEEGEIRCSGYMSEKCKMDVNGNFYWVQKEMCLYGCSAGVCSTRDCTENSQKCWTDEFLLECVNGKWKEDKRRCSAVCRENRCSEDCGYPGASEQVCWEETENEVQYRRVYNCEEEDGKYTYHKTDTRCEKTGYNSCGECITIWEQNQAS